MASLKREGIVLEGAVTAQVNAEMQVGAVEETVTVSGQSPLVDIQNTQRQAVINREMLDVLPAVRNFTARGNLIPGVTTQSIVQSYEQGFGSYPMTIHGSSAADTCATMQRSGRTKPPSGWSTAISSAGRR